MAFYDSKGNRLETVDVIVPIGLKFPSGIFGWARDNCPSYTGYYRASNPEKGVGRIKFFIEDPEDQALFKIAWGEYILMPQQGLSFTSNGFVVYS